MVTEPCAPLRVVALGSSTWALVGELDVSGVPDLEARLAGCDGDLVLDCSRLTFVDAAGLGLFVRTRNACERRGAKFALVRPSRCLARVLAITGLDAVLLTAGDGLIS